MKEAIRFGRRSFLIGSALLPLVLMSRSGRPAQESIALEQKPLLKRIAQEPDDMEVAAFAQRQVAFHQNPFGYQDEELPSMTIPSALLPVERGMRFVITSEDQPQFQSFLYSNAPLEDVEQMVLYCHSIAGAQYDMRHWNEGFQQLFQNKTAVLMPITRAFYTPTSLVQYENPGFITDSRPVDVMRSVAAVCERYPHLKELPWDVIGMSMGSGIPYSLTATWENFSAHAPLPVHVRSMGIFAPYDSLFRERELFEAVSQAPDTPEMGGIDLALKWTIQDTATVWRIRNGVREDRSAVIDDIVQMGEAGIQPLRRNMMKSSPGMYHRAAEALGWDRLPVPTTIFRAPLDAIIPPEQTDHAIVRLRRAGAPVQTITSPVPAGHILDLAHADILTRVVTEMRRVSSP